MDFLLLLHLLLLESLKHSWAPSSRNTLAYLWMCRIGNSSIHSPNSPHTCSSSPPQVGLGVIKADTKFAAPLKMFSTLLQPYSTTRPVKHHVTHNTETSDWPTHAKVRRLAPEHYKRAGVLRPNSRNWSSALHIVDKKNGEIRPCDDYRALNALNKMDRYPVPIIQELTIS